MTGRRDCAFIPDDCIFCAPSICAVCIDGSEKTPPLTPVDLGNYQSFANQIEEQRANAVNSKLYPALEKSADIEDNRAKTVQ